MEKSLFKMATAVVLSVMLLTACADTGKGIQEVFNVEDSQDISASDGSDKTGAEASADQSQTSAEEPKEQSQASAEEPKEQSQASAEEPKEQSQASAAESEEQSQASVEESAPAETPEVNVRMGEWTDVEWEQYTSVYFTIMIPKGWEVDWQGDSDRLYWNVHDPDHRTGAANLDHFAAAKSQEMMGLLGLPMYLTEGSVEEYFQAMFAETTESFTVLDSCIPSNKDFLATLRNDKSIWDYESLYATFTENGKQGEGIYSAVVMEAPEIIIRGSDYGSWEINCTFYEYAPLGDLVNWKDVLATITKSFTYTDYYYQELLSKTGGTTVDSPVNDNDVVMEAFEERSLSDTILREKESDMIGEYERVYDNDTGHIYRAYNGFLDDMGSDQTRYTSITDQQYAEGYIGWIDKFD